MQKSACVKLQYDETTHRIPATDAQPEGGFLLIDEGDKVVGRCGGRERKAPYPGILSIQSQFLLRIIRDKPTRGQGPLTRPGSWNASAMPAG